MLLALVLSAFVLILLIELPGLIRTGQHREIAVFTVVYLVGIYLTLSQLYNWPLYNPLPGLYLLLQS